jgi:hypothetical protein
MSEVAIIKDVFRNTPQVLIIRDGETVKTKSLTAYGSEIIKNMIVTTDLSDIATPDGFICTGFKQMTPAIQRLIEPISYPEIETKSLESAISSKIEKIHGKSFIGRTTQGSSRKNYSVTGTEIYKFIDIRSKVTAINFKANRFRLRSKISTVISPIKAGSFGFDADKSIFTATGNPLSAFAAEKAELKVGESTMRRFMATNADNYGGKKNRRAARRAKILSGPMMSDEKSSINSRFSLSIKSRLYRG